MSRKIKGQITRQNFVLKKIKVKGDSVELDIRASFSDSDESWKTDMDGIKVPLIPHPDMTDILGKLKRMLAYQIGVTALTPIISAPEFKATAAQKKFFEKAVDEILADVKVSGYSLTGEQLKKISITGSYKGQGVSGRNFDLEGDQHGFESDVQEMVDQMEDEAYEFLFGFKRYQMEIAPIGEDGTLNV